MHLAPSNMYPKTRPTRHSVNIMEALRSGAAAVRRPFLAISTSRRAQSEPLPIDVDGDVTMGDIPAPCSRRNSGSAITYDFTMSDAANDSDADTEIDTEEAAAGPPSPAATLIVEQPPPVYYPPIKVRDFAYPAVRAKPTAHISTPIARSASASSISGISDISAPSRPSSPVHISHPTFIESVPAPSTLNPSPAYEVFDQNVGLAEVDHRFSKMHRTVPIPGRTLRRLLDIGWITEEELKTHAQQIDLDALAQHDSRPQYPWRPVYRGAFWEPTTGTDTQSTSTPSYTTLVPYDMRTAVGPPPPREVRKIKAGLLGPALDFMDKRAADMARDAQRAERAAELLATLNAFMSQSRTGDYPRSVRVRIGSRDPHATNHAAIAANNGTGSKRRIDEDDEEEDDVERELLPESSRAHSKKRRITPESSQGVQSQPPLGSSSLSPGRARQYPSSQPAAPMVQPKQYPAPLHAYDPKIYPEAARFAAAAAAAEETSRRQPPRRRLGMGRPAPPLKPKPVVPPHEADTEEEDVDTDPEDEGTETPGAIGARPAEPDADTGKGKGKEVERSSSRPTSMRRTLGRTRTIAQLSV